MPALPRVTCLNSFMLFTPKDHFFFLSCGIFLAQTSCIGEAPLSLPCQFLALSASRTLWSPVCLAFCCLVSEFGFFSLSLLPSLEAPFGQQGRGRSWRSLDWPADFSWNPLALMLGFQSRHQSSYLMANSLGAEVAMFLGLIDRGVDLLVVALLLPLLKAAPSPTNLNR